MINYYFRDVFTFADSVLYVRSYISNSDSFGLRVTFDEGKSLHYHPERHHNQGTALRFYTDELQASKLDIYCKTSKWEI